MSKVVFLNQKGGAGKTTLTVLTAFALADAGKKVAVIDRDPQKTATRWLSIPSDYSDRITIATKAEGHEFVIIDTPGTLETPEVRTSIGEADKIIIVTQPSPADLWACQNAVNAVNAGRQRNAKAALLFNRVLRGTSLVTGGGRAASSPYAGLDDMATALGMTRLSAVVPQRVAYQNAPIMGWSALTRADQQCIAEVALQIFVL